jgi:hypothetical protein
MSYRCFPVYFIIWSCDVCGGLPHLRKYDFLNIVKTNIPLRFKENIIIFSIFITLIAGLRNQIVKYTWKKR